MRFVIALHAMDVYAKYSLLARVCSGNPSGARCAIPESSIPVFGGPRRIRLDASGKRANELWADLRLERDPGRG